MKSSNAAYAPLRRGLGSRILDWLADAAEKTAQEQDQNECYDDGVLKAFTDNTDMHRRLNNDEYERRRRSEW